MGVPKLWDLLESTGTCVSLWSLRGQTLAVDVSGWLCQVQGSQQIGKVRKPHLRTTFFRISKLLQAGITPVMVFEGYPPQLKRETINKRRHQRQSSGLKVFCSAEDRPMMDPGSTSVDTKMAPNQAMRPLTRPEKEVCQLLDVMGVPYTQSRGEAEALCARFNAAGIVDGCVSEDGDSFLFGAKTVYRNFDVKNLTLDKYTISSIEESLGLCREGLVAVALLTGCDYDMEGAHGIGINKAANIVKDLGSKGAIKRFREWREDERFIALESFKNVKKPPHCHKCHHPGNKKSHDQDGCCLCVTMTACTHNQSEESCTCSWHKHKHELQSEKTEMAVRARAIQDPNFPNKEIIEEFLNHTEELPEQRYKFNRPSIHALGTFCMEEMFWSREATRSKVIHIATSWQHQSSVPGRQVLVEPIRIIKERVHNKINVYDVEWKISGEDDIYCSEERREVIREFYPQIVHEHEVKTAALKSPKKTSPKKGAHLVNSPSIKELFSKQTESLTDRRCVKQIMTQDEAAEADVITMTTTNRINSENRDEGGIDLENEASDTQTSPSAAVFTGLSSEEDEEEMSSDDLVLLPDLCCRPSKNTDHHAVSKDRSERTQEMPSQTKRKLRKSPSSSKRAKNASSASSVAETSLKQTKVTEMFKKTKSKSANIKTS